MRKALVGVMGGADADETMIAAAYRLGQLIAGRGWVLLNGGRNVGIMEASARGARDQGGLTVGILPGEDGTRTSTFIDIQILTGVGAARNNINVLSSDVVIACPGKAGTLSEVALALSNNRRVILLNFDVGAAFDSYRVAGMLLDVRSPEEAIQKAAEILAPGPFDLAAR